MTVQPGRVRSVRLARLVGYGHDERDSLFATLNRVGLAGAVVAAHVMHA